MTTTAERVEQRIAKARELLGRIDRDGWGVEEILALLDQLESASADTRRLDWLESQMDDGPDGYHALAIRHWDHDGRRMFHEPPVLHVMKFAARGGSDESLRKAIDAASHSEGT